MKKNSGSIESPNGGAPLGLPSSFGQEFNSPPGGGPKLYLSGLYKWSIQPLPTILFEIILLPVGPEGIEPVVDRLKAGYSTIELRTLGWSGEIQTLN